MSDHLDRLHFGDSSMGYLLVESRHISRWRVLLEHGLGLHVDRDEDDDLVLRLDDHARRIVVRRGPAEDVVAIGWQLTEEALAAVVARATERGLAIEEGTADEARIRGVESFVRLRGPKALPVELFTTPILTEEPLDMLSSGFVTGALGMGHFATTTRYPEATRRFWQDLFDARLSDRISQRIAGLTIDIDFLRVNARHHSIAIAAPREARLDPIRTRIQHFNLQCATIEDLERAFERCRKLELEIAHEMGQHPNDRELSFYVLSPSGFEVELGWNALEVDEATWQTAQYDAISAWGHRPEKATSLHALRENAGNLARGLRSLLRPELVPFGKRGRA